jgi:hypothetical protein
MIEKIALTIPGGYPVYPKITGVPTQGMPVVRDIIAWGTTTLMIGASLLCLILIIWGGISWITSGGDKAGVESARKKIIYALIGLVIIFLSFTIIKVLGNFFDVKLIRFR